ncbi:hypothetical protein HZB88_04255 [archaeon]|nr:hypothetical protein [archaeon]
MKINREYLIIALLIAAIILISGCSQEAPTETLPAEQNLFPLRRWHSLC